LLEDVLDTKSMETLMLVMQCHSRTTSKWNCLMSGELTI
jgi:hypothetical protein